MAGLPRPPAGDPVDDDGAGLRRKLGIKFREPKSATKLRVARNDDSSGSDVGKRRIDAIIIIGRSGDSVDSRLGLEGEQLRVRIGHPRAEDLCPRV